MYFLYAYLDSIVLKGDLCTYENYAVGKGKGNLFENGFNFVINYVGTYLQRQSDLSQHYEHYLS